MKQFFTVVITSMLLLIVTVLGISILPVSEDLKSLLGFLTGLFIIPFTARVVAALNG